jgi:GAF domain-containing protein
MFNQIKALLIPSGFRDPKEQTTATLLGVILVTAFIATGFVGLLNPIRDSVFVWIIVPMLATEMISFGFLRLRWVKASSLILVFAGWLILTIPMYLQGGLSSPFTILMILVVFIAGLLLGEWVGALIVLLNLASFTIMLLAEQHGALPAPLSQVTPLKQWLSAVLTLSMMAILLHLSFRNLNRALENSQRSERELNLTIRQRETLLANLEKRVNDRTADLEHRAVQLQAAMEVGQAVASLRDLDELLPQVTRLIGERFQVYHVGIFLLDADGEYAVLRAANSPGGQQMLRQGYRLKVGEVGIVGYVTGEGKSRIAFNVGEDAIHFKNPYLPNTRSEMALPLIAGDRLLGALDVQSEAEAAFSEEDINVLRLLANQVAVAIENARLLGESQKALEAMRRAYGELSREAWLEKLRARPVGIRRSTGGLVEISHSETPEGQALLKPERQSDTDGKTMSWQIRVRESTIGVIQAQKPGSRGNWTEQEINLMNTLTEQLGVALESARLYQETQRRAERERLAGEITAKMRASNDPQTILQTAVSELRQALQVDRAQVLLHTAQPAEGFPANSGDSRQPQEGVSA